MPLDLLVVWPAVSCEGLLPALTQHAPGARLHRNATDGERLVPRTAGFVHEQQMHALEHAIPRRSCQFRRSRDDQGTHEDGGHGSSSRHGSYETVTRRTPSSPTGDLAPG